MTHDELIAYIDDSTNGLKHEHLFEKLLANTKALRAVVELHKPWGKGINLTSNGKNNGPWCTACKDLSKGSANYPCPTIEAIEKELNNG
jgi:hypothetical protein